MSAEPERKRPKIEGKPPRSFLTWNANGLAPRCKSAQDLSTFRKLLDATHFPDLVCIQEARLKRSNNAGVPSLPEIKAVQPFLDICSKVGYSLIWSLADGRRAGTVSLVHERLHMSTNYSAFTLQSALELLAGRFGVKEDDKVRSWIQDIRDESSSGGTPATQQRSVAQFFKPCKAKTSDSTIHTPEGRFQFLVFADLDVIHTYVPNNGNKAASHQRRRTFDEQMLLFLDRRRKILHLARQDHRALCWLGDLNVARTHLDGSHYEVKPDGTVSEFWTDESRCYSKFDRPNEKRDPADMGLPGFTRNERVRFETLLHESKLVDVWRHLHPTGVTANSLPLLGEHGARSMESEWERANYTWRGTMGKVEQRARFQGKGQRIDYCLLSERLVSAVEGCDILGYGEAREGYFCGSDHCPVLLTLAQKLDFP